MNVIMREKGKQESYRRGRKGGRRPALIGEGVSDSRKKEEK